MPEALRPEPEPLLPGLETGEDLPAPEPAWAPPSPDRAPARERPEPTGDSEGDILHPEHPGPDQGVDLAPPEGEPER